MHLVENQLKDNLDNRVICTHQEINTETTTNQVFNKKIHITKDKAKILRTMFDCFKNGGINGIENGNLSDLAEIISDTFSFDYQGSKGEKTTKKESILRSLRAYEKQIKEDGCQNLLKTGRK